MHRAKSCSPALVSKIGTLGGKTRARTAWSSSVVLSHVLFSRSTDDRHVFFVELKTKMGNGDSGRVIGFISIHSGILWTAFWRFGRLGGLVAGWYSCCPVESARADSYENEDSIVPTASSTTNLDLVMILCCGRRGGAQGRVERRKKISQEEVRPSFQFTREAH